MPQPFQDKETVKFKFVGTQRHTEWKTLDKFQPSTEGKASNTCTLRVFWQQVIKRNKVREYSFFLRDNCANKSRLFAKYKETSL